MNKLNPWTFGAVISITVAVSYILCALFWYSFTGPSIEFLNAVFHGMDFRKIYAATPFSVGTFVYVLIVFAVWAYILGVVYAVVRNLLLAESKA